MNLGHTFGHALEAATGFSDRLFHGEGVSIGMVLAAEFSAELGMLDPADAARVTKHLAEFGLPTRLQDIAGFAQEGLADADALMALMAQDKKVKRGRLTFILLKALGEAVIVNDVEPQSVRSFLARKLAACVARMTSAAFRPPFCRTLMLCISYGGSGADACEHILQSAPDIRCAPSGLQLPDWTELRDRWELSHIVRAGLSFLALALLVTAVVLED